MELLFVSFIASTSTVLTFQCRRECTFVAFEKFSAKKNHQNCSRQHNLVTTELRIYETAALARGVSHIYHQKTKASWQIDFIPLHLAMRRFVSFLTPNVEASATSL